MELSSKVCLAQSIQLRKLQPGQDRAKHDMAGLRRWKRRLTSKTSIDLNLA